MKCRITQSMISTFLKDKEKIEKQFQNVSIGSHTRQIRQSQFQNLDEATIKCDIRSCYMSISDPPILQKSQELGTKLVIENL